MEKVDEQSLAREEVELKEAGIPVEVESATVSVERPDYWHATPATSRQKELIGEQVAQGFIPEKEAREFLQGEPTISQANEFLNQHPQTVDPLASTPHNRQRTTPHHEETRNNKKVTAKGAVRDASACR